MSKKIETHSGFFNFGLPDRDEAFRQTNKNQEEIKEKDRVSLFQDAVDNLNRRALEIQETLGKDMRNVIHAGETRLHYELGFDPAWFEYDRGFEDTEASVRLHGRSRPSYKGILSWKDVFSSASNLQVLLQELKKRDYLVTLSGPDRDYRNRSESPISLKIDLGRGSHESLFFPFFSNSSE